MTNAQPTPADLAGAWRLDNWRISFSDDRPDTDRKSTRLNSSHT